MEVKMEHKILLSPDDLELIKAQIKAELLQEMEQKDPHTGWKADPFNEVRNRYAKNQGPLHKALDGLLWYKAWECIRQLSCMCAGVRYIRDLDPVTSKKAAETAEFLCKYVIERSNEKQLP